MFEVLKKSNIIKNYMPQLRIIRRILFDIYNFPYIYKEEKETKNWCKNNSKLSDLIELSFKEVEKKNKKFGSWALSKSSIRIFTTYLFNNTSEPCIYEFGSGISSLFFDTLFSKIDKPFYIHSFEHHPYWYEQLIKHIKNNSHIKINLENLKQISEKDKSELFSNPKNSIKLFYEKSYFVPKENYDETRIKNAFYSFESQKNNKYMIDGIILDGPNGSGRSIAFVLLYEFIKPNAIILIDDFDHYPFLEDLSRLFVYETLNTITNAGKRWTILRINKKI